eukprot:TRINITY_DN27915_c0_g1_i1.p1 TRINITY_DN27915_c0_g1~~TRINITY_DN27915_c0_g1_i1.p1  ORF type:complete len:553 (+),score=131.71 TRINITY_DN27915_c0_g1_i1:88-1746(+)
MGSSSSSHFDASHLVGTYSGALSEKYEILRQLGSGAQGAAYLVKCKTGGDLFVAKETHDVSEDGREEFLKEFGKMKELRHPNCTKVIELVDGKVMMDGTMRPQMFIITELAKGGDLYHYVQTLLSSRAELSEEWVAQVFAQAMRGVAYLHSKDIVHNDLKPDNILMLKEFTPSEPAKVPTTVIHDFGCATLGGDNFFLCGDPRYQAPESWKIMQKIMNGEEGNWAKLSPKADIWSMAVTLYELLSGGRLPFLYRACAVGDILRDKDVMAEMADAVISQPVKIREYCPGISSSAEDLLQKMFHKDPVQRPSASEVLDHPWFNIQGHAFSRDVMSQLALTSSKGLAHRILLNALALKLQRDHYEFCWKVFQKVDSDHNGHIDASELEEALRALGHAKCDSPMARSRFMSADLDSDGLLDFNEFLALTFNWKSLSPAEMEKNLQKLFEDIDKDKGGSINEAELRQLFKGALSHQEISEVFRRIDSDGDGHVTLEEMQRYLFEPPTEEDLKNSMPERRRSQEERRATARQAEFMGGTVLPGLVCLWVCMIGLGKFF